MCLSVKRSAMIHLRVTVLHAFEAFTAAVSIGVVEHHDFPPLLQALVVFHGSQRRFRSVDSVIMNWLVLLGIAVVIAAVAAVTGIKPKGRGPLRTRA